MDSFIASERILQVPQLMVPRWLSYGTSTRRFSFTSRDKAENIRELADAAVLKPRSIVFANQVHQSQIQVLDQPERLSASLYLDGFDGFTSSLPGVMLNVFTADCLPVFFTDKAVPRIALAHCGWRGTFCRLTQKMLQQLQALGSRTQDLLIWFGPAICGNCYEVSADLIQQFTSEFGGEIKENGIIRGRQLDIAALNRWQALQFGVPQENICSRNLCTRCRQDLLYSYRAEGQKSGRLISYIMLRI